MTRLVRPEAQLPGRTALPALVDATGLGVLRLDCGAPPRRPARCAVTSTIMSADQHLEDEYEDEYEEEIEEIDADIGEELAEEVAKMAAEIGACVWVAGAPIRSLEMISRRHYDAHTVLPFIASRLSCELSRCRQLSVVARRKAVH